MNTAKARVKTFVLRDDDNADTKTFKTFTSDVFGVVETHVLTPDLVSGI